MPERAYYVITLGVRLSVLPSKHFRFRGYITVKRTKGSFRDERVYGLVALKKTKKRAFKVQT
jgi:hypothetical protein